MPSHAPGKTVPARNDDDDDEAAFKPASEPDVEADVEPAPNAAPIVASIPLGASLEDVLSLLTALHPRAASAAASSLPLPGVAVF